MKKSHEEIAQIIEKINNKFRIYRLCAASSATPKYIFDKDVDVESVVRLSSH